MNPWSIENGKVAAELVLRAFKTHALGFEKLACCGRWAATGQGTIEHKPREVNGLSDCLLLRTSSQVVASRCHAAYERRSACAALSCSKDRGGQTSQLTQCCFLLVRRLTTHLTTPSTRLLLCPQPPPPCPPSHHHPRTSSPSLPYPTPPQEQVQRSPPPFLPYEHINGDLPELNAMKPSSRVHES